MKVRSKFKRRKSVPHWKRGRIPKKLLRERARQTEELEKLVQAALASLSAGAGRSGGLAPP